MRYFDETVVMPTLPPPLNQWSTPGPPAPATPVHRIHVVEPGETLIGISIKYEVPIQMIIDRNNITDRATIQVGRKLVVPYP
jgi:LysM repeat protein